MTKIPSDEDFERAARHMEQRSRGLDVVRERVLRDVNRIHPLHDFRILDQRDVDFRAYVFFKTDKDIQDCMHNDSLGQIKRLVYRELQAAGRGKEGEIVVAFEIDSDENVRKNYEGNYFLRLR
jgi:hypothetical protein